MSQDKSTACDDYIVSGLSGFTGIFAIHCSDKFDRGRRRLGLSLHGCYYFVEVLPRKLETKAWPVKRSKLIVFNVRTSKLRMTNDVPTAAIRWDSSPKYYPA
jgi:hypothetical protein